MYIYFIPLVFQLFNTDKIQMFFQENTQFG